MGRRGDRREVKRERVAVTGHGSIDGNSDGVRRSGGGDGDEDEDSEEVEAEVL